MPGAFEGETIPRRRLMTGTVHVAGAVAMSAIALPAIGFALGPIFEEKEVEWQPVGAVGAFDDEEYIPDRKSTRLNSSHANNSYAVFCLKKKHLIYKIHTRH